MLNCTGESLAERKNKFSLRFAQIGADRFKYKQTQRSWKNTRCSKE